jgi:hypothetical protein
VGHPDYSHFGGRGIAPKHHDERWSGGWEPGGQLMVGRAGNG